MSTNTKKKYSSRTVAKEVTDGSEGSSRSERRSSHSSRGSRQARPVEAESIGIPLPNLVFWLLIFVSVLPGLVVYLQRLWFDSIYGWLPILGFSAGIPLLLYRWDRNLRIPQSYPVILGLGAAVASGALFAIQGWTWFYFPCILGCIGVFCASNQGKDFKPLVTSGWFGFALMSLPLGYMDQLLLISHSVIRSTAINVLRWQAIPHVDLIAAIGLPSGRLYVAEQLQALISWPLFLTIAMVYSAILKRSTFVALANIGLSYGAFLLFHIGLIVCVGT